MKVRDPRVISRLVLLLAGTALGITLLVLLLRSVNVDQLTGALSNADYRYLVLAILAFLANWLLKLPRWALMFGDDAPDWDTLFGAMNVGYAINALLPARLGEIVRAYWVRDRSGVSMVQALSTIALERVTDGATLIILLLAVLPTVAFPRALLGPALTIGAVFIVALLAMAVLVYGSAQGAPPLVSLLKRLEEGRAAPLGRAAHQIMAGLQALGNRRSLLLLLAYTVAVWAANTLFAWLMLRAFHINVPLTGAALLIAVLNLGMAVPSSPGYVGVFEYLMVLTLGLYGVARADALAAALVFHFIAFGPMTVVGLLYIARALGSTLQMLRMSLTRSG